VISLSEIRKLKIISIKEGQEISTVKDIIVNSDNGSLAFFIIDQPSDYLGARIIAFNDIVGIGDYAIIIPDSSVIQDVAHNPRAIDFLQKDVKVIGAQVLTNKGSLTGQVTDYFMEEETGRIAVFMLANEQGNITKFKSNNVITYGKDIILIEAPKVEENRGNGQSEKELLKKKIEEFGKSDSLLKSIEDGEKSSDEFNVFEQRQLQFLVGKKLEKDVPLENGGLIKAGVQISRESLSEVKTRNTLMQISAHVVK